MAQVRANGNCLEYEIDGPAEAPVLLMIHGVGAQLIRWPPDLCRALVEAGFRILRFDPRDIGLSSRMDHAPVPDLAEVIAARARGEEPDLPYTLHDLAADAVGLLDALGIRSAHVLGVSLGGMVAQVMAIEHPSRVESLAIMMSQSGNPDVPPSRPEALAIMTRPTPDPVREHRAYLDHQVERNRVLGSPAYPVPEAELRHYAAQAAERAWNPAGTARQLAAGRGSADRRAMLRQLRIPALVLHGADDPLIPVAAGEDIADSIEKSWFVKVDGMGHDLPAELFGLFVSAIAANARRAAQR